MLSPADFISLEYSDDLTLAGIKHTFQYLVGTTRQKKGIHMDQLRQHVAEKAAELAFLRYLQAEDIPHKIVRKSPFTEPDQYDINLGDRDCMIKTHLVLLKTNEQREQYSAERLYHSNALIQTAGMVPEGIKNTDLVIFVFVLALHSPSLRDKVEVPGCFIHRMPVSWQFLRRTAPLGQITIRNDSESRLSLEINGTIGSKKTQSEGINIQPGKRATLKTELSNLIFLNCRQRPGGRIYLYHAETNRAYYIYPRQWWDIWVHGIQIIITGYTTIAELRKSMRTSPKSRGVSSSKPKKPQYFSYPIAELHAVGKLFKQVRTWQKSRF